MTSSEMARKAGVDERYLREWLSHQAASNYLSYDPASARFALPAEQAMVFANEESPVYMMGGFDLMGLDTNSSTSELIMHMLGAVAQWERTRMLERQKEGIAKAKALNPKQRPLGAFSSQRRLIYGLNHS